jgi:hypothetical protein
MSKPQDAKTAVFSSIPKDEPRPVRPEAGFAARTQRLLKVTAGLAVIVGRLFWGEQIKTSLHLLIPGNVIGLVVLLLCFQFRLLTA